MIKYKYLPFTHSKPRYQGMVQEKWQLKAQSLSASTSTSNLLTSEQQQQQATKQPIPPPLPEVVTLTV
jgi:hypothetical protein